ncbi:Putative F-box/LRR-repeat protein At3g28410 [Linum perenne]
MNNSCPCVCQFGKVAKRAHKEEQVDSSNAYRLSYLPDNILYHILSVLDTKFFIQTYVLSRLWRSVWKHVPVLKRYLPRWSEFL